MRAVGIFKKVSFEEFRRSRPNIGVEKLKEIYDGIRLPRRATIESAGYDFFAPVDIALRPGETATVATGIRVIAEPGWFLAVLPRSGLGFGYRLQLDNTIGIIDSDYCRSDNEGHIYCKITNASNESKTLEIKAGSGFCQGIFLPFGIARDDSCDTARNGGLGSTDRPTPQP